MKKFLAVACLMAVTAANATEVKFGDLNYFLKQGQFNLKADFNLSREFFAVDEGATTQKTKVEGYVFKSRATYGLADNFSAFVGLNALYELDLLPKGGVTTESNGLQNLIVGSDIRVMNQDAGGFNLDVGAEADIALMENEISETNKDNGNQPALYSSIYGDPRSSLNLNARLGKKTDEANEFYTLAAIVYNMSGTQEDKESDEDIDWDSSVDLKLGAFYQYRPVNELMFTLGLVATRFGEVEGDTNGADLTVQDHLDFTLSFNAKYLITENFIAKFNLSQDRRDDHEVESDLGDFDLERRQATSFGFGLDYIF